MRLATWHSTSLTGVGSPYRRPSSTISPLSQSASMLPVPRARLCHEELPRCVPRPAICGPAERGPALLFLRGRGVLDTGRRATGLALRPGAGIQMALAPLQAARRVQGVAQVAEQLGVFPAHHLGVGPSVEGGIPQVGCHSLAGVIEAAGIATHVEDPAHRCGVDDDDARLEVGGREHEAHPECPGSTPQHDPLVVDAILGADHIDVRGGDGVQLANGGFGVLALHGQQHRVARPEADLGGRGNDAGRGVEVTVWRDQPKSVGAQGVEVRASRDQHDVLAGLRQLPADDPTDRTGAVDDVAHSTDDNERRMQQRRSGRTRPPWACRPEAALGPERGAPGRFVR